jgi:hypothetical protein
MTRDDIIRLAREAGWTIGPVWAKRLERFAVAVAEHEREQCAKVCEELDAWNEDDPGSSAATAIRARGQE